MWLATIGEGVWRRDDAGAWHAERGVPADARVYSLAARGDLLVAGGQGVVYRRAAGPWETIALAPGEDGEPRQVWALSIDRERPATVYAGCRPLALLRSDDAGRTWRALPLGLPPSTPRPHTPRVTAVLVDGTVLWCGVEVGGVFKSLDGGETWSAVNAGLPSLDIHALAGTGHPSVAGHGLLAATPLGVARYDGRWSGAVLAAPWSYCRALAALPGRDGEFLCGLGDGPPGTRGAVVVSKDDGRTWHSSLFPGTAESTVWSVTVDDTGELAAAAAIGGEVFASDDAGRTWTRLPRRFTEARAVLLT